MTLVATTHLYYTINIYVTQLYIIVFSNLITIQFIQFLISSYTFAKPKFGGCRFYFKSFMLYLNKKKFHSISDICNTVTLKFCNITLVLLVIGVGRLVRPVV